MSEHDVRELSANTKPAVAKPVFELSYRAVKNPYTFQFYFDYGTGQSGPWVVVGMNDTEYAFGYQPQKATKTHTPPRENPHKTSSAGTVVNAIVKSFN